MNWKRGVLFGALLWVLIFFEVSVLMFGFGLSAGMPAYYYAHYIIFSLLAASCALLYFRGKGVKKGWKEGLYAGLLFLAVGYVLDSLITIPLFVKNYAFLLSKEMIVSAVLGVAIVILAGFFAREKRKK